MDLSKLTLGSKLVIGLGGLMLIDSFLHWQEVTIGPFTAGVSMWHGWGVFVGLLLLAILAWEVAQIFGVKLRLGSLTPSMVTALLSALMVLFTLIKVLTNNFVAIWAWIGLVLSLGIAAGAWLSMQAAGESLSDLKTSVTTAASSATAATKTAATSAPASTPASAGSAAPSNATETETAQTDPSSSENPA